MYTLPVHMNRRQCDARELVGLLGDGGLGSRRFVTAAITGAIAAALKNSRRFHLPFGTNRD